MAHFLLVLGVLVRHKALLTNVIIEIFDWAAMGLDMISIKKNFSIKNINHCPQTFWQLLVCVIGGFVFLAVFHMRYSEIDPSLFQYRDDGIITLSHAKNWVEYGFIGVGPSGERVEGYSAPMEFFIYALLYWAFGVGYFSYIKLQTLCCTFLLGACCTYFFSHRKYSAILFSVGAAVFLSTLTSFMEWHASGMENAITHVLFIASAGVFFHFAKIRKINYSFSGIVFFASISRLESIYHIFPWLIIFAVFWYVFEKNDKGFIFLLITMVFWTIYNAWRYYYFDSLLPNTAVAQDISVGDRLAKLFQMNEGFITQAVDNSKTIFSSHGGYFLWLVIPFVMSVKLEKEYGLVLLLSVSLLLTIWLNPFIFGPTRLDYTRSTTQMAIFVFMMVGVMLYSLPSAKPLWWLVLVSPLIFLTHKINYTQPYYLCCNSDRFNETRKFFLAISEKERLPRPTIANPDLGVMSWYKQFNIVDLGMLGSKIMARLKNGPEVADYFFEFAAPDLVEMHDYWSCMYRTSLLEDVRFQQRYQLEVGSFITSGYCDTPSLPEGVWIRKDILSVSDTRERKLIDEFSNHFSVTVIAEELDYCKNLPISTSARCAYVARTAHRFLPEIRKSGQLDRVIALFDDSPSKDFDRFLLTGFNHPNSFDKAIDFLYAYSKQ